MRLTCEITGLKNIINLASLEITPQLKCTRFYNGKTLSKFVLGLLRFAVVGA